MTPYIIVTVADTQAEGVGQWSTEQTVKRRRTVPIEQIDHLEEQEHGCLIVLKGADTDQLLVEESFDNVIRMIDLDRRERRVSNLESLWLMEQDHETDTGTGGATERDGQAVRDGEARR